MLQTFADRPLCQAIIFITLPIANRQVVHPRKNLHLDVPSSAVVGHSDGFK
jgi:hypothetical protein